MYMCVSDRMTYIRKVCKLSMQLWTHEVQE